MLSPSLVIFDCDGVLVDSEMLSHSVLKDMIAEHGVTLSLGQTLEHFMGTSTEKCWEVLASLLGSPAPSDFLERFQVRTFSAFNDALKSVPGILEIISKLELPFCVASNGPLQKMRFTLGHTGLLPYFEGRLFSAQDVKLPKPAPDLFLHAAAILGINPKECVVIEDSPTGVIAARAAGMRVLGFAAMGQSEKLLRAGAETTFNHMNQLPSLLPTTP